VEGAAENLANSIETVDETTVELGLQLASAGGMVLLMTIIHTIGLIATSRLLKLNDDRLKHHDVNASAVGLMAQLGLSIFLLHLIEIGIFAGFYWGVGAVETVEEALHFSASAYSTLGSSADYFPRGWRLLGAIEGLIGFILIGWSTAFMVGTMNNLTDSDG
jgi:voltage-gated potassium channel